MGPTLKTISIILLVLLVLFLSGYSLLKYILNIRLYVSQEIARDVHVKSEWTELTPSSPMKIVRQFQSVDLVINGAYIRTDNDSNRSTIFLPDGTSITRELQISDSNGNWNDLGGGSFGGMPRRNDIDIVDIGRASYKANGHELPKNRTFKSVRIRSNVPFICAKVVWRNYNLK